MFLPVWLLFVLYWKYWNILNVSIANIWLALKYKMCICLKIFIQHKCTEYIVKQVFITSIFTLNKFLKYHKKIFKFNVMLAIRIISRFCSRDSSGAANLLTTCNRRYALYWNSSHRDCLRKRIVSSFYYISNIRYTCKNTNV